MSDNDPYNDPYGDPYGADPPEPAPPIEPPPHGPGPTAAPGSTPPLPPTGGAACPSCGVILSGIRVGEQCPSCGNRVGTHQGSHSNAPTSGKAVASLVLGIISIPACMGYGIPAIICGIIAIVLGSLAVKDVNNGRVSINSLGNANAGRICGWIGLSLGLLVVAIVAGAIIWAVTQAPQPNNNSPYYQPPPQQQPYPSQPPAPTYP